MHLPGERMLSLLLYCLSSLATSRPSTTCGHSFAATAAAAAVLFSKTRDTHTEGGELNRTKMRDGHQFICVTIAGSSSMTRERHACICAGCPRRSVTWRRSRRTFARWCPARDVATLILHHSTVTSPARLVKVVRCDAIQPVAAGLHCCTPPLLHGRRDGGAG